jgi:hypothetical protein
MLMNLCQTEKARYYGRVIQKLQNESKEDMKEW